MTGQDILMCLRLCCVAVIGAFVGRFLNICIERFPPRHHFIDQLRSLFQPWNVCRRCPARPSSVERLPLVSWLSGDRRCHACKSRLPQSFPVVESISAALFALLYWREIPYAGAFSSGGLTSTEGPPGPEVISTLAAPVVWLHLRYALHMLMICGLVVATEIDRRYRIIPDGSTVPVMVIAVAVSGIAGQLFIVPVWFQDASTVRTLQPVMPVQLQPWFVPWDAIPFVQQQPHLHGLLVSVLGLLVGGGAVWTVRQVGFLTLRQEAMGFGDVVLMAMVGSVLGWQPVLAVFIVGAPVLAVFFALVNWFVHNDHEIPYGPFLSAATILLLLTWPYSWPFAKRFFDMGPLLVVMAFGGVASLAVSLYLVQIIKRMLGITMMPPVDEEEWTSADHLMYYNNERPDEQTGLWQTPQWPGCRSGRGLSAYHRWRHGGD